MRGVLRALQSGEGAGPSATVEQYGYVPSLWVRAFTIRRSVGRSTLEMAPSSGDLDHQMDHEKPSRQMSRETGIVDCRLDVRASVEAAALTRRGSRRFGCPNAMLSLELHRRTKQLWLEPARIEFASAVETAASPADAGFPSTATPGSRATRTRRTTPCASVRRVPLPVR